MTLPDIEALAAIYVRVAAQKYYFLACSVVLFWDIGITFGEEVEYIWKQKWTPFTFLWFLLRYIPPLMQIVVLESLFDPFWTPQVFVAFFALECERWLPFAGSVSVVCVTLVQCVFALRLYALYGGRKCILIIFGLLLVAEVTFMGYSISQTVQTENPPGITGCAGGAKVFGSHGGAAFWAPSFVIDFVVFVLTVYKSYLSLKKNRSFGIRTVLLRDGSLYFICVLGTNTINMITSLGAPVDLSTINANLAAILPVVITTHLILNLKAIAHREDVPIPTSRDNDTLVFNHHTLSGYTETSWSINALVDVLGDTGHRVAPPTLSVNEHRLGLQNATPVSSGITANS